MKKNNGSLHLWLWTLVPLLCMFWQGYRLSTEVHIHMADLDFLTSLSYQRPQFFFIILSCISIVVCQALWVRERDSATPAAITISKAVLFIGFALKVVVPFVIVQMRPLSFYEHP